ncbi:MAG: type-F conjugative transfer system secretin TraK, partial [Alphaproteobacteria bacterium]|nr:type-F conjugative transfer system secretin TraK [Alphaproteobacteria bacterium]
MKIFSKKSIYLFLFLSSVSGYAAEVHNLSEGTRIQTNICPTEMNRISVQGDRIAQVFGAEGKFTHQVDEETGQFFLKPLSQAEGGFPHVPVSLTLITESGLTQDMTLFPREKTAATILLKPSS